jgi:hypothetical protein
MLALTKTWEAEGITHWQAIKTAFKLDKKLRLNQAYIRG